jgi:hypothetical protein
MSDLKEAFKSLSLFDTVPQEILCQIIEKVGTPILINDLDNLRSAYPKLSEQFNFCVSEIDFTNGATFPLRKYDKQVERTVWDFSKHWQWKKLNKSYPGLKQYRIAVSYVRGKSKYDDVFKFLGDPRARWLYVSITPSQEKDEFPLQKFYQALSTGVSERIKRYGANFTVVIRIESYVDLPIGFVYQNGLLSFKNMESMGYNLAIQRRIIEIFQSVIQILGARSTKNLSELFEEYGTSLLKSVTKVSLNRGTNDNPDFTSRNESAFFRFLTEIHYNPYNNGFLANIPEDSDDYFLDDLENLDIIYPRITVMELPISVYNQTYCQRYFPNVTKFVYLEQLRIDYHKQELTRLEKYFQHGLDRLQRNPDNVEE